MRNILLKQESTFRCRLMCDKTESRSPQVLAGSRGLEQRNRTFDRATTRSLRFRGVVNCRKHAESTSGVACVSGKVGLERS
jgi:hypothetical protein